MKISRRCACVGEAIGKGRRLSFSTEAAEKSP